MDRLNETYFFQNSVSGAGLFTRPELAGSINPGTRSFLFMPRERPWLSRIYLGMMLGILPRIAPKTFISGATSILPEPDRQVVLSDPAFQSGFLAMVREAVRQGMRGAYRESLLSVSDWGFPLQEIQMPIQLWHGEADQNIPVEMARFMADALPRCEAKFYTGEGHLSLFKKMAEQILRALL